VRPTQINSFLRADEELCRAAAGGSLADRESGSTALVALVSGTQLLVANAGDSRCHESKLLIYINRVRAKQGFTR
jgi:serine/threonine protein phosphatase PrpC